jgi:hypothetical protein
MATTPPQDAPVDRIDLAGLRAGFDGVVLEAGDAGYEDARRVWNGAIDRRPACIARCGGVADIDPTGS